MGEDREIKTISWNPSAHVSQSGDQKGGWRWRRRVKRTGFADGILLRLRCRPDREICLEGKVEGKKVVDCCIRFEGVWWRRCSSGSASRKIRFPFQSSSFPSFFRPTTPNPTNPTHKQWVNRFNIWAWDSSRQIHSSLTQPLIHRSLF